MKSLEKTLTSYNYVLPKELIALTPAKPRDSARLLIVKKGAFNSSEDVFRNITAYLPTGSVLVLNKTKVLPSRMRFSRKKTGGKVELLFTSISGKRLTALADRPLAFGETLCMGKNRTVTVISKKGKEWEIELNFPPKEFSKLMKRNGRIPLPPYLRHSSLSEKERRKEYQSVFAQTEGSIAAPTASLHFTSRLMHKMRKHGHSIAFVTLHVGLGTFAPLTEENVKEGKLHTETYSIDKKTAAFLLHAKKEGRPIIAVGTTVARTLESAFSSTGKASKLRGETRLFIRDGYRFKMIDGLITNFHVPKSSLLMLVAALMGKTSMRRAYAEAIRRKFRFFSFGDAMLIN